MANLWSIEAAHAATQSARTDLAKALATAEVAETAHAEQRKQAATAAHRAGEQMIKAQTERDEAVKAAAEARERAAKLVGQVEAMQQHNAALLGAIGEGGKDKPRP